MSKVLIIEDEVAIAELEKDYLELSDFEVTIEHNGAEGCRRALAEDFDIFVLDLMLPDMDGFEICKRIREVKNTNDLKPSAPIHVLIKDLDGNPLQPKENLSAIMQKMSKAEWCAALGGDLTVETIYEGTLYIPSSELSDPEEEKKKLNAEKERLEKELDRSHKMLSNQSFIAKAPEAKVQAEKDKLAAYEKQYQAIVDRLAVLNH